MRPGHQETIRHFPNFYFINPIIHAIASFVNFWRINGCVKFLYKPGVNVTLLTQSVTFGFRFCIRTNPRHVYLWKRFLPLFFATHKKRKMCYMDCRFSGISPVYFLTFLSRTFWCCSGANVTLLTQSVTFGFRFCIRTNPRHVYLWKPWTPVLDNFEKSEMSHLRYRCPIR